MREEETQKGEQTRIFSATKQEEIADMLTRFSLILILAFLSVFSGGLEVVAGSHDHSENLKSNTSTLPGIEFPDHMSFNAVSSSPPNDCSFPSTKKVKTSDRQEEDEYLSDDDGEKEEGYKRDKHKVKLHLKRRSTGKESEPGKSVAEFKVRDLTRIQTLHTRVTEKKNQNTISRLKKTMEESKKKKKKIEMNVVPPAASPESYSTGLSGQLVATLESGVSLGSGEYFIDVFVGTPPKHFSLILDTGSDLNWIQCVPCYDCFEQNGPYYDPKESSSFKKITCNDPRCQLVSSPDPPQPCKAENQTCPYYYWYGDSSNTTGDFSVETFRVNLSRADGRSEFKRVENVMFGCGHWNRGLFHGAAGLLGLGRGPLSFSSQLQSVYGQSFSYCLVDRNSESNVSSKLIFGEDKDLLTHPDLNFTALVNGKQNAVDTFYYLQIKSIKVGGEMVNIPEGTWNLSEDGGGGTIIDSGTTLSYFAEPAYEIIKKEFVKKVKGYRVIKDFPLLDPCYNVSGVEKMELPEFGIVFSDGAEWNFPVENYFIWLEEDVVCLAILGTPRSALSIIGNYQQQNFHILYDINNSRLGYAPMSCAQV